MEDSVSIARMRCEFERKMIRNQPMTPERKACWRFLRASFENAERYPDHPLVLKFLANDLARFEASLTQRHDGQ